jgi:SAM-dependent methyltransferase
MVDPHVALTEARRVLRPGGRLVLAVWGPPAANPFFTAVVGGLVGLGLLDAPDPDGPGVFRLADGAALEEMLAGAGFDDVRVEAVPVRAAVADVESYIDFVGDTAGPIGLAIQALAPADRAALDDAVVEPLRPYSTDEGLAIPGLALCARAE